MQVVKVTTQEQNAVVAQNRGYWGYEEIDHAQLKQIAGAGDGDGDGDGGCGGCGGCGNSSGGNTASVSGDDAYADAAMACFDAASFASLACLGLDAFNGADKGGSNNAPNNTQEFNWNF